MMGGVGFELAGALASDVATGFTVSEIDDSEFRDRSNLGDGACRPLRLECLHRADSSLEL
jgi:hypothetical protein